MDTLDQLIDRRTPIDAGTSCADALDRFIREPGALALAVVDGATPVGLLARDSFLVRMENPEAARLIVRQVCDPDPLIADVSCAVDDFLQDAMTKSPGAILSGFIAVESGRYVGVGTAVDLLAARAGRSRQRAQTAGFLSRLGEEIVSPLQEITAAAERLRRLSSRDDVLAQVEMIELQGGAALGLLQSAADLQRAERGQREHSPEPRRVQDLMDEVESRWQARAENGGVTLLCSYDGDPDCVANLDSAWFHKMLDALIAHALNHVRSGVIEASLKTRKADTDVIFEGRVRDNASSHTAAYLKQMFSPSNPGFEKGEMGVAMDLALAARHIGALGGTILAEQNVGAGASVAFSFTTHAAVVPTAAVEPEQTGRRAHVLVVDDNATNRMVVEALCEMFDCSTESVTDGVEAVEAARHGRFDVILMDIKMPRMDGVTATREIRAFGGPASLTPIIALTANADPDEVREYMQAGMQGVVEKPIKPERLLDALELALDVDGQETSDGQQAAAAAA